MGLQGGFNGILNVKYPIEAQQTAAPPPGLLLLTCGQGPSWPEKHARALKEIGWLFKQSLLNMILQLLLRDELQGNSCVVLLGNQGLSVI